jgi:serine/threonine-protein kinase
MATVYLAHDLRHDRPVALKVLHPELAATLGPERFLKEIRLTAGLQHPHILPLHDSGEAAGLLWYTMPYVEGESLRDRLRREHQIPIELALGIAREVADALDCAHRAGVIHRDIKPDNILLTKSHALVADFGVARALTAAGTERLTETGLAVGTPAYMSPEQAAGDQALDARSDIYSLGCVLYEMLAGQPPFTGASAQAIIARRLAGPVPSVRVVRETVPESVDDVLARAMAKTPADRFASAREFQEALASGPAGTSGTVRPRGGARRRRLVTIGSASALAVIAGLYFLRDWPANRPTGNLTTLAVLPFQTLGASEESRILGMGIPDAIITRLANVRQLRVRPTSAILRYEGLPVDVQEAGRTLATDYVVVGTIQPAADRLRVSVQLVQSRDGTPRWGEHYDVGRQEMLSLQDSIAGKISSALAIRMTMAEQDRVYHRYTQNADAYELYLEGRSQLVRLTKESTLAAIAAFERALRLDSRYALALAGLAMASADMHLRFASGPEVKTWGARAEEEARRALALDSNLAEAHLAMAAVYRKAEFNWEGTLDEGRRALELNPSLDLPHYYRAAAFYHLGLLDLASREVDEALAVNPVNYVEQFRTQGIIALIAGKPAEAIPLFEKVRRLSDRPVSDSYLAQAYFYAGDTARAEAMLDTLSRSSSASAAARARATLASFLAADGERAKADGLLRSVESGTYTDHHVAASMGSAYAQLGWSAEAVRALEQAAATGFPCYPWFERDPLLQPLRGDRAFQGFLAGLRRTWESAKARYAKTPPSSTRGPS